MEVSSPISNSWNHIPIQMTLPALTVVTPTTSHTHQYKSALAAFQTSKACKRWTICGDGRASAKLSGLCWLQYTKKVCYWLPWLSKPYKRNVTGLLWRQVGNLWPSLSSKSISYSNQTMICYRCHYVWNTTFTEKVANHKDVPLTTPPIRKYLNDYHAKISLSQTGNRSA